MAETSKMLLHDAVSWIQGGIDVEALRSVRDTDVRDTVSMSAATRLSMLEQTGVVFCVRYPRPSGDEAHQRRTDKVRAILRLRQLSGWSLEKANGFVMGRESRILPWTLRRLRREGWDIRPVDIQPEGGTP